MDTTAVREQILNKLSFEYKSDRSISNAKRLVNFVHTDMGFDSDDKEPLERSIFVALSTLISFCITLLFVLFAWAGHKQDYPSANESELLPWAAFALLLSILIGIAAYFTRSKYCAFFEAKEQLENCKSSFKNKAESEALLKKYGLSTNGGVL